MMDELDIQRALHAHRVVPIPAITCHGPLGLEHLAAYVVQLQQTQSTLASREIALPMATWKLLEDLAREVAPKSNHSVTAADMAAALIERALTTTNGD